MSNVVPDDAFLSLGQTHNKLIGMNAVHFAAEVGDETLSVLLIWVFQAP